MFENFGLEISKLFKSAELIRYDLRHPYVGSEHLLLAILKENDEVSKKLKGYGITYSVFKKELLRIVGSASTASELNLYTPLLKRIIENAGYDAKENNNGIVTKKHLLISMFEEGEGIALRILLLMNVDIELVYKELKELEKSKTTVAIDHGIVLNDKVEDEESVVCREKEIDRVLETLLRHKKNNPILVGKAGVGQTAIVEEIARRINKKEVPQELIESKIVMIEMGSLVSGTKYRGEFEEKLTKIIDTVVENPNIILFIDEIHSMVNAGSAEGAISAADILKPYLARGSIKVIGATTLEEYNRYFFKDKALSRRFEKIVIDEPSIEDTKLILKSVKKEYEKYHQLKISDKNITDIVELSDLYLHDKCNPDKSIELLDSICAKVKRQYKRSNTLTNNKYKLNEIIDKKKKCIQNNEFDKALKYKVEENKLKTQLEKKEIKQELKIEKKDILQVIEEKTCIPLTKDKNEIIKKITQTLENEVIGQQEAIDKIKKHLLSKNNKVKSMLFIGSSGIGKTKTAKIIAQNYNLIKLDMSEYTLENAISKLIGTSSGYVGYDEHFIFEEVREKPYSLILIDEIEKASSKVLNLFLNILDEGKIVDAHNEPIYFNNCLIIATGNIKTEKNLGFGESRKNFDKFLSKELIARFDEIIEFKTLTYKDVYAYIKKNYKLNESDIKEIIASSDYIKYGLRNVENAIREKDCKICI